MINKQNLIPTSKRSKEEVRAIAKKGGINSGIARREKRDRQKRMQELFSLAVRSPKIIKNLEAMGIKAKNMDIETAMDARMAIKVMQEADTNAYKALKAEAYGPMVERTDITSGGKSLAPTVMVEWAKPVKGNGNGNPKG